MGVLFLFTWVYEYSWLCSQLNIGGKSRRYRLGSTKIYRYTHRRVRDSLLRTKERWILIGNPSLHNFYRLRRTGPPSGILIFRRHFIFYDCSLKAAAFCFTCEKYATEEPPFFEFKSKHHFSQLSYTEYRFRTSSIYPLHSLLITSSSSCQLTTVRLTALHPPVQPAVGANFLSSRYFNLARDASREILTFSCWSYTGCAWGWYPWGSDHSSA